jgi:hypothetical protein
VVEGLGISPDSDELEMMRLDHIPEEYFAIWGERELLWASTLYDGELSTVRAAALRSSESSNMNRAVNGASGS